MILDPASAARNFAAAAVAQSILGRYPVTHSMNVALLGGGVIARLVCEEVRSGALPDVRVTAVMGRSEASRGRALADAAGAAFVTRSDALVRLRPDVVVEAASHDAVRAHAGAILDAGISLVVLSAGALCDDALRAQLEATAARRGATLYVPSGGIGGLDALKAACAAGVDEVVIRIAKPPAAWKGIDFVETLGLDLDRLGQATTLFQGTAREGVPLFPANVNIAAVLSMAGVGFDRTRMHVVADPAISRNTHTITVLGRTGSITVTLESVPSPDNPKTAMLACYSAIAALRSLRSPVRYGT